MKNYREIIEELYIVFSKYEGGAPFDCGYCHPDERQQYYIDTPLKELSGQHGYELVTEVADHWVDSRVYRHYLPRILELLGPPYLVDDLCPEFIFDKLDTHEFEHWDQNERDAIFKYFSLFDQEFPFVGDKEDWDKAYIEFLKTQQANLGDDNSTLDLGVKLSIARCKGCANNYPEPDVIDGTAYFVCENCGDAHEIKNYRIYKKEERIEIFEEEYRVK